MAKKQSNFRMSDEARVILRALATKLGISRAAVLELAIRRMAQSEYTLTQKERKFK